MSKRTKEKKRNKKTENEIKEENPVNAIHAEIADWLKKVRFRKSLFGVNEEDVWRKIEQLDALYSSALKAERVRYDALLEEHGIKPDGE